MRHLLVFRNRPSLSIVAGLAVALVAFIGCDAVGPTSRSSKMSVGFTTVQGSSAKSNAVSASVDADSLVLTGSNGTLKLADIRLIVSDIELEGEADSAEFDAPPSFLDVPLDSTEVAPVATDEVPPGVFSEFEFEVEDVDLGDEGEEDEEEQLRALRDTIRQAFPDWPAEASMVAVGTFVPEDGEPRTFTTYFEAEIEIERELDPPIEVTGDGFSRDLTVKLAPSAWFGAPDDTVLDLSAYDYTSTGELVELEFEDGVVEVEAEDEDDDDDDDGDDD